MSNSELHQLTPLEMARNCVAAVLRAADHQDRDPVGAYIAKAGTRGAQSAELAGQLALVSIAEDLRRIAGPGPYEPGVAVRFYFDDADPVARCECGWHAHGDAAVDAFRAWWKHQADTHAEQMGL